jgi:TonB-linked SusC/RagA family outer membrane protein
MLGATSYLYGQSNQTVTGQVLDAQSMKPLPGVNILVVGTSTGAVTDAKGHYAVSVSSLQDTLRFSFIGYKTKTISINGKTMINVNMAPKIFSGKQLVVVGYGKQKRQNITTSISTISGETVTKSGSVNPLSGLQGKVAGVDITKSTGRPGANFNIIIRGKSSLTGSNSPLYVVDGVIEDNISFLNPQSIKNISILKSAAATAIYGSRGSNGVVIVTTKKGGGEPGQLHITYNGYVGFSKPARLPDFMNGKEWWEFRQDAYITDALQSGDSYNSQIGGLEGSKVLQRRVNNHIYTDWADYMLRTAAQDNQYVSIGGITSNSNTNYNIGFGYQNVEGTMRGQAYKQYNIKTAVNTHITDKWSGGINVNIAFENNDLGNHHAIKTGYRMSPLVTPYDSLGNLIFKPGKYAGIGFTSSVNPLADIKHTVNNIRTTEGFAKLYLQYSPLKWLQLKSSFAPKFDFSRHGTYHGPKTDERQLRDGAASLSKDQSLAYIWNNKISASRDYGKHHFDVIGLYSVEYHRYEGSNIDVANLPYNSSFYSIGTAKDLQDAGSYYRKTTLLSFFARLKYSYANKYLITLTDRYDGSSVLASGHKWTMFPSISVGWRLSEEKFLQNANAISELKLRASYGVAGNNDVAAYSTQVLANVQTFYNFGNTLAKGLAPNGVVNHNLTWEKTRGYDIGLDYGFLNNRLNGSIDYYHKLSKKLLLDRQLPFETGAGSITENIGSVKNTGIGINLTTVNIQNRNFRWTTSFTFSKNNNKIVSLYGTNQNDIGNGWFIGEPINVDYTYVFDGIWQQDQAKKALSYGQTPGQARVKDLNGDGSITSADRTIIGTPEPSWTGGFSTGISYKGIEFSTTISTRQGVLAYSAVHEEFLDLDDRGRAKLDVPFYMPPNKVTPTRHSNSYPQPHNEGPYWLDVAQYQDASYVEINNIRLGYTLPQILTQKIGINTLNVYFDVHEPFIFTPYGGFDPQWPSRGIGSGDNVNSVITYQFGLKLRI